MSTLLPPGWDQRLHLANAARFPGKDLFYKFKKDFLCQHARFIGWKAQVIQERCWGCSACAGWYSDYWYGDQKCNGDGWYINRTVFHREYTFGAYTFLVPDDNPPPLDLETIPKFNGFAQHGLVSSSLGKKAYCSLLFWFDTGAWATMKMMPFWHLVKGFEYRIRNQFRQFSLRTNLRKKSEPQDSFCDNDIPF